MSSFSATYSSPVTPPADLVTSGILNNISNVALTYANQVYNWGQGVFSHVMDVTDANISALTQAADTAMTGANTSMNAFNNSFMPDYQALRTEAANYANPSREARNAGMAESSQMQAGEAARRQAEENLKSYGIDPSSGRYADLDAANRTASAASAAGAGTQSIRADEMTALGLQKQALDYGIQLPGISANFLNQANQARAIGQNAITSAANTGANLMQLPNAYLSTAMANKYPPSGQSTTSTKSSTSPPSQGSRGGTTPGGGGSGFNSGAAYNPNWDAQQYKDGASGAGFTSGMTPNASSSSFDNSPVNGTQFDPYTADNNYAFGGQSDPLADMYGGYNNPSNINGGDANASYNDPYGINYGTDPGSYSATNFDANQSSYDDGSQGVSGYSPGGFDSSSSGVTGDQSFNTYGSDYSSGDNSGFNMPDTSSFASDGSDSFAAGGAIPDPTSGGRVPMTASPSHGAHVDDVHAKLNAGEFVVPTDVAAWKGHEFFQNLIAKSRKARAMASAQGKPTSPPTGPVRFASHPVR